MSAHDVIAFGFNAAYQKWSGLCSCGASFSNRDRDVAWVELLDHLDAP